MRINKTLKKTLKTTAFVVLGAGPMVLASVPRSSEIANDTAIYQNLHEINVKKVKSVDFDSDIRRLSAQEKSYHESLPTRVSSPLDRIQKTPYQYRGKKKTSQRF